MSLEGIKNAVVGRFGRIVLDLNDAHDLANEIQKYTGENR